jgi:hypothetical protein
VAVGSGRLESDAAAAHARACLNEHAAQARERVCCKDCLLHVVLYRSLQYLYRTGTNIGVARLNPRPDAPAMAGLPSRLQLALNVTNDVVSHASSMVFPSRQEQREAKPPFVSFRALGDCGCEQDCTTALAADDHSFFSMRRKQLEAATLRLRRILLWNIFRGDSLGSGTRMCDSGLVAFTGLSLSVVRKSRQFLRDKSELEVAQIEHKLCSRSPANRTPADIEESLWQDLCDVTIPSPTDNTKLAFAGTTVNSKYQLIQYLGDTQVARGHPMPPSTISACVDRILKEQGIVTLVCTQSAHCVCQLCDAYRVQLIEVYLELRMLADESKRPDLLARQAALQEEKTQHVEHFVRTNLFINELARQIAATQRGDDDYTNLMQTVVVDVDGMKTQELPVEIHVLRKDKCHQTANVAGGVCLVSGDALFAISTEVRSCAVCA